MWRLIYVSPVDIICFIICSNLKFSLQIVQYQQCRIEQWTSKLQNRVSEPAELSDKS